MSRTSDNWDPKPSERIFYRDAVTGDLGYMVRRDGEDHIRLDRPQQEVIKRFRPSDWRLEEEPRAMTRAQAAQVAFAADCQLCHFIGKPNLAKRKWLTQSEELRIEFMDKGPAGPEVRRRQFQAIMAALMEA